MKPKEDRVAGEFIPAGRLTTTSFVQHIAEPRALNWNSWIFLYFSNNLYFLDGIVNEMIRITRESLPCSGIDTGSS